MANGPVFRHFLNLPTGRRYQVIVLAVAYVLASTLAHAVAPSGVFASLVWTPAGIALGVLVARGMQLWMGVWLGAWLANSMFQLSTGVALPDALVSGCWMGAGATLQALVGAMAVRKFCGAQPALDSPGSVCRFIGFGVLATATISPSFGVLALAATNSQWSANLRDVWLTWWAGDVLGSILVAPMVIAWLGKPRDVWRNRRSTLIFPLLAAVFLVSVAFVVFGRFEQDGRRAQFEQEAGRMMVSLQGALRTAAEAPNTLTDFYRVSGPLGKREFESLAARIHARQPGIQSLLWVPSQADPRRLPVAHVFPIAHNENLPGLDLARLPVSRAAADQAFELRKPVISSRLQHVDGALNTRAADDVLAFSPVFWAPPSEAEETLRGYVVAVISVDEIVRVTFPEISQQGLGLRIEDPASANDAVLTQLAYDEKSPYRFQSMLDLGGRPWRLTIVASQQSPVVQAALTAWPVYLGGVFFCALLVAFLLVLTGYSARAERLVLERTRDLETARQASERAAVLLREAVSSIAQGFTIYDEQDRLMVCNEAYLKIYEDSRDLIVPGRTFEEIVRKGAERGQYRDAIGRVDAWVADRVRQHQKANGEVIEQQLGDGRWLMIVEYRTPSGFIAGNRIDITPIKQASAVIADRNAQLDALFTLSPDGFVALDHANAVQFANPAFFEMTGIRADDIMGRNVQVLQHAMMRRAEVGQICPEVITKGGEDAGPQPAMLNLAPPLGRTLQIVGVMSNASSIARILYFRDVTREVEVNRMKSEFLSHAAHELRTPMTSILGFAELMLLKRFSEERQREIIETIHRQTRWLVDIINELLDLARIEARRGKDFSIAPLDVVDLLREVTGGLSFDAERWPVRCELPEQAVMVLGDRAKLRQALVNLMGNAQKYSPDGGAIEVRMIHAGERVGIDIADHGLGMTPDQLANFGERFWRADTSGKTPGTGLGVSIVKEIVNLHGGNMEVSSRPGAGTRVIIWLPADAAAGGLRVAA